MPLMPPALIIDFDSTFVRVEALDELAKIALRGNPQRAKVAAQVAAITRDGMEGRIGFAESLRRRLALITVEREHLDELVGLLRNRVTPSLAAQHAVLAANAGRIYIVSGGFKEYIVPVVSEYGIAPDHVLANTFEWDGHGVVSGCDLTNPLSRDGGKVRQLYSLALKGEVMMVGDGYSDYETRAAGAADTFVAFVENAERTAVTAKADYVAHNFGDVVSLVYSVKA